jgi:hypothetical protein
MNKVHADEFTVGMDYAGVELDVLRAQLQYLACPQARADAGKQVQGEKRHEGATRYCST